MAHLPPRELWPDRIYVRPEFRTYPDLFNAAEELLDRNVAEGRGDRVALVHESESWTYRELLDEVDRCASALQGLRVAPGDRVLIRSLNEPAAVIANFAVLRLGGVVVPTSPALDADGLTALGLDCEPVLMIVSTFLQFDALVARRGIPSLREVVVYGTFPAAAAASGCLSFESLCAEATGGVVPARRARTDVSVLLYTSGMLEPMRATAHFQEELLIIPDGYGRHAWQVSEDDIVAGAGPINFAGGYSTLLTLPFRFGATAAIVPLMTSPAGMFEVVRRHGITLMAALPTRYQEMLDVVGADPADLASLRMVSGGGEPLEAATAAGWRERFGLEVFEGFGTNGMMHVFVTTGVCRHVLPYSMGQVLPGYESRVLDAAGHDVAPGTPGRLYVRGPVGTLFWGNPAAAVEVAQRQAATVHDGWVRIGDWVTRDAEGNLSFVGRDEDVTLRCGDVVGPLEIERALTGLPGVAEVGAYVEHVEPGAAEPGPGTLVAVVVPTADAPADRELADRLVAHARSVLPGSHLPDVVTFVDALPRSPYGLVLRRSLWPTRLSPTTRTFQAAHCGVAAGPIELS